MMATRMNDFCPICKEPIDDNSSCFQLINRIFAHHECVREYILLHISIDPLSLFTKWNEERKRYE